MITFLLAWSVCMVVSARLLDPHSRWGRDLGLAIGAAMLRPIHRRQALTAAVPMIVLLDEDGPYLVKHWTRWRYVPLLGAWAQGGALCFLGYWDRE